MQFSVREWLSDATAGAFTGAVAGWVGTLLVPEAMGDHAIRAGALCGLTVGLLTVPWKALFDWLTRRRRATE